MVNAGTVATMYQIQSETSEKGGDTQIRPISIARAFIVEVSRSTRLRIKHPAMMPDARMKSQKVGNIGLEPITSPTSKERSAS